MNYYKDQIKDKIDLLKSEIEDECSEVIMSTDTYKALKEEAFFYYYKINGAPIIINDDMDFLRINLKSKNGYTYGFTLEENPFKSKKTEKLNEPTSPSHYKTESGKEVWEMMVDIWGKDEYIFFCKMNAFKYRMRAGKKEGNSIEQDIQKAMWYENKIKELNETTN